MLLFKLVWILLLFMKFVLLFMWRRHIGILCYYHILTKTSFCFKENELKTWNIYSNRASLIKNRLTSLFAFLTRKRD